MNGSSINVTASGGPFSSSVACPSGTWLVGGGFSVTTGKGIYTIATYPSTDPSGGTWSVRFDTNSFFSGSATAAAYALCAS